MGVTIVTSAGNINVTTARDVLSAAPSGWDEQVAEYGRGYTFGNPSQLTVYRLGDDADIESTILGAARSANALKMINQIDPNDFTKVLNTNSFGNLNLWTDINGLQVYGDNYLINHITGFGIYRVLQSSLAWNGYIDAALSSSQNGFTDWFGGSFNQHVEIFDSEKTGALDTGYDFSPLNINTSILLHTSTTDANPTSNNIIVRGSQGSVAANTKTSARQYILWRKHF